MINKDELLKLLPKLIREDNEIKGAIITALSGVVATKEDIARLIEQSNRRFEEINKRFEEASKEREKRFEEINKRFEEASKERNNIKEKMIILRETVGDVLHETEFVKQDVETVKQDIKNGNKEILDYLRDQFDQED